MKKIFKLLLTTCVSSLALVNCGRIIRPDGPSVEAGEGSLRTASLKVSVLNEEKVVYNRSVIDVSGFTVKIFKKINKEEVKTWLYSEMPEVVTLTSGDYTLQVFNSPVQPVAFDAPYFFAEQDFSIVTNEITEIGTVQCKLANTKVSVRYGESLAEALGEGSDVNVKLRMGEVSIDVPYSEHRPVYFEIVEGATTLSATFTGTIYGFDISETKKVENMAAGQHCIITFALKEAPSPDEAGSMDLSGVSISSEVSPVNLNYNITVTEDEII